MAGALKGVGLGFMTPFCTYSAIPLFAGMLNAGVRTSATAGFLLAAPLLDPLVFAAIAVLFSLAAAVAYAVVAFTTVLAAAVFADLAHLERWTIPTRVPVMAGMDSTDSSAACGVAACSDPFSDESAWRGWHEEARGAADYAVGLVRGMLAALVLAVALAALISGVVPQDLLARVAGAGNPLAVPAAAALGAPFYVSTAALVPIAAALLDHGAGLGAAFALVVAGAGVNVPEFALLSRFMRRRLLLGTLAGVFGVAVACGYLAPAVVRLVA